MAKQPWNRFPLASLKVMDVSPCAKIVLIYLAARSNYKGGTFVGVRTIARELMKSTRFVIKGLKELREKEYLVQTQRDRRDNEADWKTLTIKVLSAEDTSPVGEPNALGLGEPNAPGLSANVETKPYRLKSYPNLADSNLAVFEASKQGSKEERLAALDASVSPAKEKANPTPREYAPVEPSPDIDEVMATWTEATGHVFSEDEAHDCRALLDRYGLAEVLAVLRNTLFERPKSAGIRWDDFRVFARNYDLNHGGWKAWQRARKAKLGARLPEPGSHASKNPELHTAGEQYLKHVINI